MPNAVSSARVNEASGFMRFHRAAIRSPRSWQAFLSSHVAGCHCVARVSGTSLAGLTSRRLESWQSATRGHTRVGLSETLREASGKPLTRQPAVGRADAAVDL